MSFLNPLLMLGALGLSLPILAHLLNRYQVKHTDWAAMRFLNRTVRVRSRQLRLRDLLLLLLRCLALLFVVFALTRPTAEDADGMPGWLGEKRAGVVIALDASFSMQHNDGAASRFEKGIKAVETLASGMHRGDPVTLVLLGAEHRVVTRNEPFAPERFADLLPGLEATFEPLAMDSVPRRLKDLAADMKAPQKEVYIITDMQAQDWTKRSVWLQQGFDDLARSAAVFVVPVPGGAENLAITGLDLVSGVLRKGTSARYRATVRNCGEAMARNVRVNGLVNNISTDAKVIPAIAPGTSESVSLFLPFRDPGPVRIAATLDEDGLDVDNVRRSVAVIRDRVSVLCVEGTSDISDGSGGLVAAALRARGNRKEQQDLDVQSVSWVDLPGQDVKAFDVVILADVPDIAPEQARLLERYVREGNGLIWFGGNAVKPDVWNRRSAHGRASLLPAVIEERMRASDAMGIGRPLDPSMPDHPVCRPLLSLPEDLLSETRFRELLRVTPSATGMEVLTLAGSDAPILIEHTLGRGHVFMFTTSAGPAWNNMAVTPVFPMLLQQMVTYLTAREFETPRTVGDSLSLSYADQPDATDAVFDTPAGDTVSVPVLEHRDRYVAVLDNAREAGFYLARVSLQAAGMPIAVNVDTRESTVKSLSVAKAVRSFGDSRVRVVGPDSDLLASVDEARTSRSLWRVVLLAGLALLVIEALLAEWLFRRRAKAGEAV